MHATLRHPLMRQAANAAAEGQLRRESPVMLRLNDGSLCEGRIDLAFREAASSDEWVVVDFKTDREIATDLDRYERQLGIYISAVARSTGMPTRGVLLRI